MAGQQVEYVLIGENTLEVAFVMEVSREMNDHNKLYNKSLPNQHPISSITGLTETLSDIDTKEGNLEDLTTDNKENLVGAINEVDSHADTNATNLENHIADKNNPHEVTKTQVGLGNCDNTSDLNKPISTATQSALDLKVNTADLGNAELDIQKNGVSVGKFTANASTDKVINIVVPTQASDVNALPDTTKYGASLVMSINSSTFVVTAQLKDQDGNNLGSAQTIDLPLESVVVNGSYDSDNKKIILTLENGNTIDIPVGDLVAGLQSEITVDNKLASDLVDDSEQTNKFVTSAEKAQITTNANNITNLQSGKADKSTTYTKTEVDTIASGKANVGLDNLNANGQMIIDSQNGTISNCILEIPQNLKLTLENNVLTAKSGSILTDSGSTYQTITLTSDKTTTISTSSNQRWGVFATSSGTLSSVVISSCVSGATDSLAGQPTHIWFDTTNQEVLYYGSDGTTGGHRTYPLCIIDVVDGVASFAKDSHGNDMIFNGAGFIGHHIFTYPNVKTLIPNGFNEDGSLKSIIQTNNALRIAEMTTTTPTTSFEKIIQFSSIGAYSLNNYREVETEEDLTTSTYSMQYVKSNNTIYVGSAGNFQKRTLIKLLSYSYNGTTVTKFDIRQPVRLATTEMLDKVQDQVDTNTTAIATKANDSEVAKIASNNTFTGLNTFSGDYTEKLTVQHTDITRGTNPQSLYGSTFIRNVDSNGGMLGSIYNRIDTSGNVRLSLVSYNFNGNTNAQLAVCYDADDKTYAICPTPDAAANGKEVVNAEWLTTLSGYDGTKSQSLHHVSGVWTWVDD